MRHHFHRNMIVIVSAYSSGVKLAPLFRGRGYPCVHVTTAREWDIKRLKSAFKEKDFIENFIVDSDEDLAAVLQRLRKFNIKAVLPGCESGVSLADVISQRFNVPRNDHALTVARRNKFFMIEAIKKRGLLHPNQCKSNNLNDILQWAADVSVAKVVLKPLSSSSSDSVFYCSGADEITKAFKAIHGASDMYSEINGEVLAQEFIDGDEYIVNTVSRDGAHYVVDIWKGVSHDKSIVSNDSYADLVHPDAPEYQCLREYVAEVLSALGVENGPAHSEIKLSPQGPCLIETGARLAGKVDFASVEEVFGYSQISLTAEAMLEPDVFKQRLASISMPKKHARYVYFATSHEGLIRHEPDMDEFTRIESVASVKYALKMGDQLRKTSKAYRSPRPGYAYLVAESESKIEKDYLALRKAETNLYSAIIRDTNPVNERVVGGGKNRMAKTHNTKQ